MASTTVDHIIHEQGDTIITVTQPSDVVPGPWPVVSQPGVHGYQGSASSSALGDVIENVPDNRVVTKTFLVSSHILTASSQYFKNMLVRGNWKEAEKSGGRYRLIADADIESFRTLMNILHYQYEKVPERINLEKLVRLGVVVDYHKCSKAVTAWTGFGVWLTQLGDIRKEYYRSLVLRIWVYLAFQLQDQFRVSTRLAIHLMKGGDEIPELGLPLANIGREARRRRIASLQHIATQFRNLYAEFSDGLFICPAMQQGACGSMLAEALNWKAIKAGIPVNNATTFLEAAFMNMKLEDVLDEIKAMDREPWQCAHGCHLAEWTGKIARDVVEHYAEGMNLEDIKYQDSAPPEMRIGQRSSEILIVQSYLTEVQA